MPCLQEDRGAVFVSVLAQHDAEAPPAQEPRRLASTERQTRVDRLKSGRRSVNYFTFILIDPEHRESGSRAAEVRTALVSFRQSEENLTNLHISLGLAMSASALLGAVAVTRLNAQNKSLSALTARARKFGRPFLAAR
jgi:hypothetical protein